MTSEASEGQAREPLWTRIAGHAFMALLVGSAVLLAVGGAPSWVERTAVVFLWVPVVLVDVGMAAGMMAFRQPVPEALRRRQVPGRRHRGAGARIRGYVRRLLQLLFVAALVVAGRPVLAGLYVLALLLGPAFQVSQEIWISGVERPDVGAGRWAVYRMVRFVARLIHEALRLLARVLRWILWIPLVAAVAACLWLADIRLKRPLRRALGLPQTLAHILYGRPYRALWQKALPAAFWLAATALALWLSLGSSTALAAGTVATLLWDTAIILLALAVISLLVLFWLDIESSIAHHPRPAGWPRSPGPYLMGLLRLVFLGALCVAGAWGLAGLYLALVCIVAAMEMWPETDAAASELTDTNPFPAVAGLIGLVLVVSPFVVAALPAIVAYLAYRALSDARTARRLRETHAGSDGLLYFLYAEPHQREYFLGEGGLLQGWRERVVARDWRTEIKAAMSDLGWAGFIETAEGRLLDRFEISNMRADLPFLAVVTRRRLRPFRLGEAYRARRRDDGKALGELERRIGKRLAKSFTGGSS